jgi:hypothetical protein
MQQRQLRLGDILDDYCPRERRLTNHAVVAMIGDDVKQTRCTTCEAEHVYKHAKVPRQRRKSETPAALYAQVAASGPKRVAHEAVAANGAAEAGLAAAVPHEEQVEEPADTIAAPMAAAPSLEHEHHAEPAEPSEPAEPAEPQEAHHDVDADADEHDDPDGARDEEDGPIHRRLIRASLPRPEGQQPPARPIPEFTIRQPGGRPNRFRPRHQRSGGGAGGGHQFSGNRPNGSAHGGPPRGMRPGGSGRPPQGATAGRRHGHGGGGRKRSK